MDGMSCAVKVGEVIFRLGCDALVQVGMHGVGDTLTSPTLDGFSLELGEVFVH